MTDKQIMIDNVDVSECEHGNIMGGQLKAYADLRQFLIDNAERVTEDYLILMEARQNLREKYKNQ